VDECLHAVGQGAIAIECREDDDDVLKIVWKLNHRDTMLACVAERAIMRTLVSLAKWGVYDPGMSL
jgi:hydroxymethylbilane synthase